MKYSSFLQVLPMVSLLMIAPAMAQDTTASARTPEDCFTQLTTAAIQQKFAGHTLSISLQSEMFRSLENIAEAMFARTYKDQQVQAKIKGQLNGIGAKFVTAAIDFKLSKKGKSKYVCRFDSEVDFDTNESLPIGRWHAEFILENRIYIHQEKSNGFPAVGTFSF